jgi:hypothetical protein
MGDSDKRYNKVLDIIDRRLIPDEGAKKARGEVFTPLNLVRQMLLGLRRSAVIQLKGRMPNILTDEYYKVLWGVDADGNFIDEDEDDRIGGVPLYLFRDPKSTFIDPANGIGNFPVVAFYILDYQLGKHGPSQLRGDSNTKYRREHIVKNMLYMIELNKGNVNTSVKIFNLIVPTVKANICCTNTLEITDEKLKEVFGINRFIVCMGNPPFQAFQEAEGKRGGGDELYMKFVRKSLDFLNDDGYLVFLHPPSWRKPEYNEGRKKSKNAGVFDLMAHQNQIEYLEIHNAKDGKYVFNAGTRYDFYTLKKTPVTKSTIVKDMYGKLSEVNMKDFDFLPNFNIANVKKLLPSKTEHICDLGTCIMYERSAYATDKDWVSSKEDSVFKYPLIHSTTQKGPIFRYSKLNNKGMFGVPKVIFGDGGINEPFIDLDGKYGMTQHAIGLAVDNKKEADRLSLFLKSNFFKNILSACAYSSFQIEWRMFTYFKEEFWNIDVDLDEPLIILEQEDDKKMPSGGTRFNKSKINTNKRYNAKTRKRVRR